MYIKLGVWMCCASLSGVTLSALAVERGQLLADTCLACHGGSGHEATIPNLRHYPASMIVSQMKAFRDGTRPSTVMGRHAKGYSDADVVAIAQYLGIKGQ